MPIFNEIALLVVIAVIVAFLMRLLRQPLIIGYIITGLIGGPLILNMIHSEDVLRLFSEIGIALLLFIVGLNLTPHTIKTFGKVSFITGFGQVIFTASIGWLIARWLGFSPVSAIYLGVALAFSSTIIILKLLSDKGHMERLYGKISIGFLLVQDFIAVLILFLVPLLSIKQGSLGHLSQTLIIGVLAILGVYLTTRYLFPHLHHFMAKSQELLFLFAIAWGLGMATLFRHVGFSLESGALIAGISLSTLPSHDEIHARLKPLRDFFIILFFVLLGAEMVIGISASLIIPALVLSAFVLIGNPIIVMIIMGLMGYRKKTAFQTGLTVAQISEFSLIVVALGLKLGHVSSEILSLATLVGLVTIFGSTYMIMNSEKLFEFLSPILGIFEKQNANEQEIQEKEWPIVLFGQNRIGHDFFMIFKKMKKRFLVIDYDPEVVEFLQKIKLNHEYGDASDIEFLRMLNFKKTELIVSTIPDFQTNILILKESRRVNRHVVVMAVAHSIADATDLYKHGVDYVIMPHFLGGKAASQLVKNNRLNRLSFRSIKKNHLTYLKNRKAHGHEHPTHHT